MKKYFNIVILILCMIFIFIMSNSSAIESSDQSGIITTLLNKILKLENVDLLEFIIRKLAHLLEYIILGILMINCLKDYNIKNIIFLSILFCFIYACTDEVHQLFIPGRSGKIDDVLLDTLGSIIGVVFYKLFYKNKVQINC